MSEQRTFLRVVESHLVLDRNGGSIKQFDALAGALWHSRGHFFSSAQKLSTCFKISQLQLPLSFGVEAAVLVYSFGVGRVILPQKL